MNQISHEEQHQDFPPGTPVFALNGEALGSVREVHDHYILVGPDDNPHVDLRVPPHAVARYDGGRIVLSVNREALTVVDDAEAAGRRLGDEDPLPGA